MTDVLVTGGAGFIGSHLVDSLLEGGFEVCVVDNVSSGSAHFLSSQRGRKGFGFIKADLKNAVATRKAFQKASPEVVFHFAANPSAGLGADAAATHLNNNVVATYNVLDSLRQSGSKSFVLASTSTVYGRAPKIPTPETTPLEPVSIYGASKLACEGFASAFADNYGVSSTALRFANVVGPRSNHGILFDFVKRLKANPRALEVLGDGRQRKSYVHVADAVGATLCAWRSNKKHFDAFNVGSRDASSVAEIAQMAVGRVAPKAKIVFKGGAAWKGDVTQMRLDCSKLLKLGWKPRYSSGQALEKTLEALVK